MKGSCSWAAEAVLLLDTLFISSEDMVLITSGLCKGLKVRIRLR